MLHEGVSPAARASAQVSMGVGHQNSGRLNEAVLCYRQAIELDGKAYQAHNNLGSLFASLGDRETALVFLRAACALNPAAAEVQSNLASALSAEGLRAEALEHHRESIRLDPASAEYRNGFGNTLRILGRYEEAQDALQWAIALRPKYAEAHVNLGTCFWEQGRVENAEACFRRATRLAPELATAHTNLSKLLLRAGDFRAGWAEAEWRWRSKEFLSVRREFGRPQWRGEPLEGAPILLHAEQGFGDTIQFARYAPLVAECGGRVVLEVQPELRSLMQTLPGVEQLITRGEPLPDFDWHCPLMSLPLAFGTEPASIPAQMPYLSAGRSAGRRPPSVPLRVGLVWAGSATSSIDHFRSLSVAQLAPLREIAGVSLVCLQRGSGASEARHEGFALDEYLPETGDFDLTAEWMGGLDLVITVDSAVAHLAGAMSQPVWILVPAVSDWRWLVDREDSPWYPTARLFRQERSGEWGPVVERVARELAGLAASREEVPA